MTTAPLRLQTQSLFTAYAVAGIFWGAFAASVPAFQAQSGLGPGAFGLVLGTMSLTALPVMQGLGRVLHRVQNRAIPLALSAFAAGNLILAASTGLWGLVVALMVLGGASGALDIALNARTARIEDDGGARLFNRAHAIFPFAMLLSAATTGVLRDAGIGPAAIFPGVALAMAASALLERRAGGHQRPGTAPRAVGRRLPLAGPVVVLAAIAALGAFQEMASQSWGAIFVETARGGGAAAAGFAPAAFTLGLSLGRLIAHGLETRLAPMPTVLLAACLAIPAFLAIALLDPFAGVLVAFLLAGVGVGPVEPAVFRAVARNSDPEDRGPMLATVTGVAYLGYLLSPPVLGQIAGAFGFATLWAAAAFAAAIVGLLTLLLPRRQTTTG